MLWQPLLLTGLGGVLAIAGTVIGQFWHARTARQERHEQWAREDAYRLHGERREAYAAFYLAAGHARLIMATYPAPISSEGLAELEEARMALWKEFVSVRLIGVRDVLAAARTLLTMVDRVAQRQEEFAPTPWVEAIDVYVGRARRDLIPGGPETAQPKKTSASA